MPNELIPPIEKRGVLLTISELASAIEARGYDLEYLRGQVNVQAASVVELMQMIRDIAKAASIDPKEADSMPMPKLVQVVIQRIAVQATVAKNSFDASVREQILRDTRKVIRDFIRERSVPPTSTFEDIAARIDATLDRQPATQTS